MSDDGRRLHIGTREIDDLLDELPLALDREEFVGFLSGFPRRYLAVTAREEIVKHFLLTTSLGERPVISSLSPEGEDRWKLVLIARDRRALFARIAGSLSWYGGDIVSAEAFGNSRGLVLDTFVFADREGRFSEQRDQFQNFLEEVIEGGRDLESLMAGKLRREPHPPLSLVGLEFHPEPELRMTRMSLVCGDHLGLLYELSRCIGTAGADIQMAYIRTVDGQARDEFYLSRQGRALDESDLARLRTELQRLEQDPALSEG